MLVFWLALLFATAPAGARLSIEGTGASGGSGLPPADEVVEFPDLLFSTKVYAPDPKTGCRQEPGPTEVVFLPSLPCEPDSFDDMCRYKYKEVKDAVARKTAKLKPYFDMKGDAFRKVIEAVEKELGPQPPEGDPKRLPYSMKAAKIANRMLPDLYDAIDAKMIADFKPSTPQILDTIAKVRATFRRALASAPKMAPYDYLLDKIMGCELSLRLNTQEIDDNATMGSRVFDVSYSKLRDTTADGDAVKLVSQRSAKNRRPDDGFEILMNPLEESKFTCRLTLMPATWLECVDASPACVRTLFHELGHTLNSCNFYYANVDAKVAYENYKDASVDSLKNSGVYAKFLADETLGVAHAFARATGCLTAISNPHDAVTNSCPRNPFITEEFYQRCGTGRIPTSPLAALPGYPAQWDEAEADFWGATGLAKWLEEHYSTPIERRRAFYNIWSTDCESETALYEEAKRDIPHVKTEHYSDAKPLPACARVPLEKPRSKPWADSHQSDRTRTNRNLMRNSDLRRTLGCPDKDPRIPLTCSPIH